MPRYIDAEALKAYVSSDKCNFCKKYHLDRDGFRCKYCSVHSILNAIDRHKTANVIEVVRCGECKYYTPPRNLVWHHVVATCDVFGGKPYVHDLHANDFCSRGERRS